MKQNMTCPFRRDNELIKKRYILWKLLIVLFLRVAGIYVIVWYNDTEDTLEENWMPLNAPYEKIVSGVHCYREPSLKKGRACLLLILHPKFLLSLALSASGNPDLT